MTTPATRISGTSKPAILPKLPSILKFPQMFPFEQVIKHLKSHLCYVMRHFGNDGISVLVVRRPKNDDVVVIFGDWKGNSLELDSLTPSRHKDAAISFAEQNLPLFLQTMRLTRIEQAQFFLAFGPEGLILVDVQVSLNKMCGPGMIRDIFGKVFKVPEVLKIEILDDRAIEYVLKGTGNYEGDLVIKPSRFSLFSPTNGAAITPLYAEMRRN